MMNGEMKMKYDIMLPLLRGALRAGSAGPSIRCASDTDDSKTAGETLVVSSGLKDDPVRFAAEVRRLFLGFRESHGTLPRTAEVGGELYILNYAGSGQSAGRVAGKSALVTGGAQGIGEEIVRHLADEGAFVFIADLNLDKAAALADELNGKYSVRVAEALKVDVYDENSVEALVSDVVKTAGGLDILISNAGVLKAGSVRELSKKDFEFVTNINYTAYFLCVKHFSRMMAFQNMADGEYFSDIIQINSKSGLAGSNKNGAYAGGKFGGIGLTQSFALELVEDNIKVNSICPGNFFEGPLWSDPDRGLFVQYLKAGKVPGAETVEDVKKFYESKVPMGRGCRGIDVARAIFYVVEQQYETGQAVPVTGGQVMLS